MAESFQAAQKAFAAHLRHPEVHERPSDVEDRRMQIYRDLFYNNIENFISSGFPVLRTLYNDGAWYAMVRDFFHRHQCLSPYFLEITQEFLQYLQNEREPQPEDPPFLLELAHYEWVELALDTAEQELPSSGYNSEGDLLAGEPVVSPLAWVLQYQYPVHKIDSQHIPEEPPEQPSFLVVARNRDDQVKFMEINAVTARLLLLLQENEGWTGLQVAQVIQQELQHPNAEAVAEGARQALNHMRQVGVVLGSRLEAVK